MSIAIASNGKDINSIVSDVAGRAPFYLIFNNKELIKTIKNPFAVGGGGAGLGVAKLLEKEQVNLLIVGKIGENMQGALDSANIKFKPKSDKSINQIIEEL
ncbi:MAG: NifB/NifX family molybdenum-iron cluster-binding protein [Nanoarchaeota archaeon]|nr:NifB/NifX family molybdenum-iron cluster-binding protein [Nanoarchaeota archaeon]